MSIKLGTSDISQITPGAIRLGANSLDRVYSGTSLVWERGQYLNDPLNSVSAFTISSTGSGISAVSGEARWAGTSDGQGTALYNTSALTTNQYVACVVGSAISTTRASGLVFHCDTSLSSWYGLLFEGDRLTLLSNTGRWLQNVGGAQDVAYSEWNGSVSSGDLLEMWNVGTTFYVTQNGTNRITYNMSSPMFGATKNKQGFGIYRTSWASSGYVAEWWGGDAGAWGKI